MNDIKKGDNVLITDKRNAFKLNKVGLKKVHKDVKKLFKAKRIAH